MANAVIAVEAEVNCFTFKESGVAVEIARRVIVVNDRAKLFDFRIATGAQPLLSDLVADRTTSVERSTLEERSYTHLIKSLLQLLGDRFVVFYDIDNTLDSLRMALPREKILDVGLHIHLRNDALRYGDSVWVRSHDTLVMLEGLWLPLLTTAVPADPVAKAYGLMRLIRMITGSGTAPPVYPSANYTS